MSAPSASTTTLVFAGTLGDAFIVLCKLYVQYKTHGRHFRLIRHSMRPEMDKPIAQLFGATPFIDYVTPCRAFDNLDDLHQALRNSGYDCINTHWQKGEGETYPLDYDDLNPYPVLQTPTVTVPQDLPNIGIQLHCGAEGSNFRGFSLSWLAKVRKMLPPEDCHIHLFGTGAACYQKSLVEALCREHKINNLLGQCSFTQWLSFIKSMDIFISLEGFAALFSMSQKVPSIVYNQYACRIDRSICPRWAKDNAIFYMNSNRWLNKMRWWKRKFLKQDNLYSPGNLRFVREFSHSRGAHAPLAD